MTSQAGCRNGTLSAKTYPGARPSEFGGPQLLSAFSPPWRARGPDRVCDASPVEVGSLKRTKDPVARLAACSRREPHKAPTNTPSADSVFAPKRRYPRALHERKGVKGHTVPPHTHLGSRKSPWRVSGWDSHPHPAASLSYASQVVGERDECQCCGHDVIEWFGPTRVNMARRQRRHSPVLRRICEQLGHRARGPQTRKVWKNIGMLEPGQVCQQSCPIASIRFSSQRTDRWPGRVRGSTGRRLDVT
jgi:hypothetical protein